VCSVSPLRRGGLLSALARGLVDRDAKALGRAAGGESRSLPGWATGVIRDALAPGRWRGPPEAVVWLTAERK
jgi:hypothetical protein